ncbi:hypothetical protein [Bacillus sp. H1a]|uniref:hypothetical protein n=1 Tax=Bacillus sp. H1a TaxID=1397276 RepID=UPI0013B37B16|nr:hypothetical protein [Bacillus sp. H1a]
MVFEACAQKIGEARIPAGNLIVAGIGGFIGDLISALAADLGLALNAAILAAAVLEVSTRLGASGLVEFDACVSATPTLEGHLLRDKIINCGDVDASVIVRTVGVFTTKILLTPNAPIITVTIPAGTVGCTLIALTIQEEEEACGVLPTDCIFEQVIDTEGSTTCVVNGTTVNAAGLVIITKLVIVKAAFVVLKKVVRAVQSPLPTCSPGSPCPPSTSKKPC